jgi:hypothetical protein
MSRRVMAVLLLSPLGACGGAGPTTPTGLVEGLSVVGDAGQVREIGDESAPNMRPRLVRLDDDRPLLVWTSDENNRTRVWASRVRANGWAPPQSSAIDVPGKRLRLESVPDRAGGALAVVEQIEGGSRAWWSISIDSSGGPGLPERIDVPSLNQTCVLSRDASGAPMLAWVSNVPRVVGIAGGWMSRHDGSHWSAPELVVPDQTGTGVYDVHALSDGRGLLQLFYVQDVNNGFRPRACLEARRWTPNGWTASRSYGCGTAVSSIRVEVGAGGHGMVAWGSQSGTVLRDDVAHCRPGGDCESDSPQAPNGAQITTFGLDAAGSAVVLWFRPDKSSNPMPVSVTSTVWANRRTASGWTPLERIEENEAPVRPLGMQLSVLDAGGAVAAWRADGAVWINRMNRDGQWSTMQRLEAGDLGVAVDHHLLKVGVHAWLASVASDGARLRIWASRLA